MPKRIREAANLNAGDTLSFGVQSGHSRTLDEWSPPEDEKAWRDL